MIKNITRKEMHVHHKIPFLISKDNSFNNLITLCKSCHRKTEAQIFKELKLNKQNKIFVFPCH